MLINAQCSISVDDMDDDEVHREIAIRAAKWLRATDGPYKDKAHKRLKTLLKRRAVPYDNVVTSVGVVVAEQVAAAMPGLYKSKNELEIKNLLASLRL